MKYSIEMGCLLALPYYFSMKKWNFSGRALSKEKRKDHAE